MKKIRITIDGEVKEGYFKSVFDAHKWLLNQIGIKAYRTKKTMFKVISE